MKRRLPPLNALRAFEAAARHLSFTNAADELNVTQGAVSQQVRALEDYLGAALFVRDGRSLTLTDAGRTLVPGLTGGFDLIAEAVESLARREIEGPLTVSATPSFAAMWLVPRLSGFRDRHPEFDVRLDATTELVDFAREDIDIAIRYGPGDYPGLCVELLLGHVVTPVCAPRLLDSHPLDRPEDLRRHTLIHCDWSGLTSGMPDWAMWLKAAGVEGVNHDHGPVFNHYSLAVDAALQGQGVALASRHLVQDHVEAGRLMRPFDLSLSGPGDFAIYLVAPERNWRKPKIQAFREWLHEEARKTDAAVASGPGTTAPVSS